MYLRLHLKFRLSSSDFNEILKFSTDFRKKKKTSISNFMKIRPVEAELFNADERTDGQTDMTKLTVAFRNSANAHKASVGFSVKWFIAKQTATLYQTQFCLRHSAFISSILNAVYIRVAHLPGTMSAKFYTLAINTCGTSEWNLLHVPSFWRLEI